MCPQLVTHIVRRRASHNVRVAPTTSHVVVRRTMCDNVSQCATARRAQRGHVPHAHVPSCLCVTHTHTGVTGGYVSLETPLKQRRRHATNHDHEAKAAPRHDDHLMA